MTDKRKDCRKTEAHWPVQRVYGYINKQFIDVQQQCDRTSRLYGIISIIWTLYIIAPDICFKINIYHIIGWSR